MVHIFPKCDRKQAIRNLEIAERIQSLYEEMKHIFSETLSSKWSINALDYIFTNPIFRNNRFHEVVFLHPQQPDLRVYFSKRILFRLLENLLEEDQLYLLLNPS